MKGTNAKTVEVLERERERESLNIKDVGFIKNAVKLYIKYKELKISLAEVRNMTDVGNRKSEVRDSGSDICFPTSAKLIFNFKNNIQQNAIKADKKCKNMKCRGVHSTSEHRRHV